MRKVRWRRSTTWAALGATAVAVAAGGCGSGSDGGGSGSAAANAEDGGTALVSLTAKAKCDASPSAEEMMAFRAPKAKRSFKITLMEVSLAGYSYQALAYGATKAAEDAGVELDIVASQGYGTAAQQTTLAQNVLAKGTDGLVFTPADVNGSVGVVDMAEAQDIPTVVTFSEINTSKALSVNQDDFTQGEIAADTLAKYVDSGSGIVQGGPSNATWAVRRTNGFKAGLEQHRGLKIGAVTNSLVDPGEGLSKFTNAVTGIPDVRWVYAVYNLLLPPASIPPQYKGRIFYLGGAYDPTTVKGLQEGSLKAVVADVPVWQGYMSVSRLVSRLNGDDVPNRTCLPNPVLTEDDIGSAMASAANLKPDSFDAGQQ